MSNGLGRGLSSLIPQKVNPAPRGGGAKKTSDVSAGESAADAVSQEDKTNMLEVEPDKIKANPMQPRERFADHQMEELAASIREYGVIQPLIVSRKDDGFELIAGERRLKAAKAAGLKKVPVIVREVDRQEKLELALIENLQREDLNSIERAVAYRKLMDEFDLNIDEAAKRVGKPRSSVSNTLRFLNLPEEIQLALIDGKVNEGHAKILAGLDTEVKQMTLFRKIIGGGLSVYAAGDETRRMGGTKEARVKINYRDNDREFAFREFFGTKVAIRRKQKGGQIIIDFYSDEELEEMAEKIKK